MSTTVVLAVELVLLYLLGSYTMSGASTLLSGSLPARALFYLLIFPGVVLHESAHYLACKLLLLEVTSFVPFNPKTDTSGRTTLGYVGYVPRGPLSSAAVGIAPLLLNPAAALTMVVVFTPLTSGGLWSISSGLLLAPSTDPYYTSPLATLTTLRPTVTEFAAGAPLVALIVAYLLLSFCVGSSLSREDLSALPAAALLLAGGLFLASTLTQNAPQEALLPLVGASATLYALPTLVTALAAGVVFLCRLMLAKTV